MRLRPALAALCALSAALQARAIELYPERGSPFDLALTGRLAGVPAGETRYARWSDLRSLPTQKLTEDGEFVPGPQVLTVLFLDELLRDLPVAPGADTILATCSDGYASVFNSGFIARYRPFLVLEINGKGPGDWPPPGLAYNPGPYVVTVSPALVPAVRGYRDITHKKPWGVTTIEVASYADRYRPILSGKLASLSPQAADGREIWINSCASCHVGPVEMFSGTKAGRPFPVVAAYARYDRPFFEKYIRDPKSLVPSALMEAHPHYTNQDLANLEAFIAAAE
ncbi:MAG TPA: cytochrome c [Opitutaceae bacterium]